MFAVATLRTYTLNNLRVLKRFQNVSTDNPEKYYYLCNRYQSAKTNLWKYIWTKVLVCKTVNFLTRMEWHFKIGFRDFRAVPPTCFGLGALLRRRAVCRPNRKIGLIDETTAGTIHGIRGTAGRRALKFRVRNRLAEPTEQQRSEGNDGRCTVRGVNGRRVYVRWAGGISSPLDQTFSTMIIINNAVVAVVTVAVLLSSRAVARECTFAAHAFYVRYSYTCVQGRVCNRCTMRRQQSAKCTTRGRVLFTRVPAHRMRAATAIAVGPVAFAGSQ